MFYHEKNAATLLIYNELKEMTESTCCGCDHYDFSTRSNSDICNFKDEFISTGGCENHSVIVKINEVIKSFSDE